jgi:trehalose 6-phosphate synthase
VGLLEDAVHVNAPDGIILASDRGPVTFTRSQAGLAASPRSGSVTAILDAAARSMPGIRTSWIALSTSPHDRDALAAGAFSRWAADSGYTYEPIVIGDAEYRDYYAESGARMLWMAHHNLWQDIAGPWQGQPPPPPRLDAFRDAYQRVNRRFGEKIAAQAGPRTLVLLHDYQLATAPGFLREVRPELPVALFTHTPFAEPDALAHLPGEVGDALLAGMLGADLLGFQRQEWAENFLDCCVRAGYLVNRTENYVEQISHRTFVRCYPVPMGVAALAGESASLRVLEWERRLGSARVKNIVRIERADPAKNVVRGIEAFGLLLARRPEFRGAVNLIACLVPSRPEVAEYRDYAGRIQAATAEVLSSFPGSIRMYQGYDRQRALAALRIYDVLYVNPIRDGMNLVALEGPAINGRHGALVLSRGAGAASVLMRGAVKLNDPRDVSATADALHLALTMSQEERTRRARLLHEQIARCSDPARWVADQLYDLTAIAGGAAPGPSRA